MTGVFETALISSDGGYAAGADRPYLAHFDLREEPFPAAASARAYFLTSASYQVLEGLRAALASGTPLMRVSGGDGVGKTLLAEMVPSVMTPEMEPVVIDAARLGSAPFALVLRRALGMPETTEDPLTDMLAVLATARDKNVSPVLLIDNAHLLGAEALEALDHLLTPPLKGAMALMQVILIGTPHLDSLLAASAFPRLRRTGSYLAELVPFTRQEATDYVGYRLRKAQAHPRPQPLFDDQAVQRLVGACCGNPRLLNVTCEAALLVAYAEGADRVLKSHADRAIDGAQMPSRLGYWLSGGRLSWVAGVAGILIGAGLTAGVIGRGLLPLPFANAPAPVVAADTPSGDEKPVPTDAGVTTEALIVSGGVQEGEPETVMASTPEAGDTAVLEAPDGPVTAEAPAPQVAPTTPVPSSPVTPPGVPGDVEVVRGRTVKPHADKPEKSVTPPAPVETVTTAKEMAAPTEIRPEPAIRKPAPALPVKETTPVVADRKAPAAKGPPPAQDKPKPVVVSAPQAPKTGTTPAKPKPVAQEAAPAPVSVPAQTVTTSAGTPSGRQQNGRWVWQ